MKTHLILFKFENRSLEIMTRQKLFFFVSVDKAKITSASDPFEFYLIGGIAFRIPVEQLFFLLWLFDCKCKRKSRKFCDSIFGFAKTVDQKINIFEFKANSLENILDMSIYVFSSSINIKIKSNQPLLYYIYVDSKIFLLSQKW